MITPERKKPNCPDTDRTNYPLEVEEDIDIEKEKEKNSQKKKSLSSLQSDFVQPSEQLVHLFQRVCGMGTQLLTWLNDCKYPPEWIQAALIATEERKHLKCLWLIARRF